MTGQAHVVWDDSLAKYDFGPGHPLAPVRVQLAMRLARDLGLVQPDHVEVVAAQPNVLAGQRRVVAVEVRAQGRRADTPETK